MESHFAPDRLPINQYIIVCILSVSFEKYIIKLVNALKTAFKAVPAKISLIEVALPPMLDNSKTKTLAEKAPIKADTPIKFSPKIFPKPNIIALAAPKEAPEETPKIYGSAKGFFTMACITVPQTANPAPIQTASIILGKRNSHTISNTINKCSDNVTSFCNSPYLITYKTSSAAIGALPKEAAKHMETSKIINTIILI